MSGGADRDAVERRPGHRVDTGRERAVLEVTDLAVEAFKHRRGARVVEGVGAQGAAEAAHHDRGRQTVADDVTHHEADGAVGQLEDVVPVAPEITLGRHVPGAHLEPGDATLCGRQQAALQHQGGVVRAGGPDGGGRVGDATGEVEEGDDVLLAELARLHGAHVQDADQAMTGHDGDAQQRVDVVRAQHRVEDVLGTEVMDAQRLSRQGDAAGEPVTHRHPGGRTDGLTQAHRRSRLEDRAGLVDEQQARARRPQGLARLVEDGEEGRVDGTGGDRRGDGRSGRGGDAHPGNVPPRRVVRRRGENGRPGSPG